MRDALVEFEAEYDQVIARRPPDVCLCQYDVREFSGRDVFSIPPCA